MTIHISSARPGRYVRHSYIGVVEQRVFKGGEVQVRLPAEIRIADAAHGLVLEAYLRNSDDLMALMLTVSALRELPFRFQSMSLRMRYVPYARQDRVCAKGEANSIKVLAAMINSLNFDAVEVWDPHSDVTPALINNCRIVSQADIIKALVAKDAINPEETILVCPDAGALKKVYSVIEQGNSVHGKGKFAGLLLGTKHRNVETLEVESTAVNMAGVHLDDLAGMRLLVVDDICDGGRTFIELVKAIGRELNSRGVGRDHLAGIDLYVTHGIFCMGLEPLMCFDRVLTVNNNMWRAELVDKGQVRPRFRFSAVSVTDKVTTLY